MLLAAVAGGLRDLLLSRREPVDGLVLKAFVPVSLHTEGAGRARGNQDAVMVVPLPVGEPDPVRRLELIAADTRTRKQRTGTPGLNALPIGFLQRAAWRMVTHQRTYNVSVTNALGVGALSYTGQLALTAVADRDTCPDLEVFADGVRRALHIPADAVGPTTAPAAPLPTS